MRKWNMREAKLRNEKELLLRWTSIIFESQDVRYYLL